MKLPQSKFKRALGRREPQLGLWLALTDDGCAEIAACAGFDWLLIDAEHAPNDLHSILSQLRVIAAYPAAAVVRVSEPDANHVKQVLELGAQNIMVPMIHTAEEAAAAVSAMRYPPAGIRGVGSGMARSSRWGNYADYLLEADQNLSLIVQAETERALTHIDEIAETEGVDGVFLGAADLAADLGHLGNPAHAEVQERIVDGIHRVVASGKAAGVLTADLSIAKNYVEAGASFVATGVDSVLLARSANALASSSRQTLW